jgi:hypothetical protein
MTTEEQLREAAQNALLTLDGIADSNPRDKADFENKDEWITWAKSRAKWAGDKLRAPISQELFAERVLKQMLEQDAALTHPALASKPGEVPTPQPQAHADASPWLPIETAPKDGTAILVSEGRFCHCVEWIDEFEWWAVDDNKLGPFRLRGAAPTHWMPLPPAPDAARQQQEGV